LHKFASHPSKTSSTLFSSILRSFAVTLTALCVCTTGLSKPGHAQTSDQFYEEPERQIKAEKEALKTAKEAAKKEAGDLGAPIEFKEILADPDNIDLNFRYARQQVARGDLKSASATLERILLITPDIPEVRLFYAIVLFRLDNINEAEAELDKVAKLDLPADVRSQVDGFLTDIGRRRQTTRYTASISMGFHSDTNRNAAPSSKTQLLFDNVITGATPHKDTGILSIGNVSFVHDLGFQDRHEIFGSFTFYQDRQRDLKNLDIQSFSVHAGGIYKAPWADITLSGSGSHMRLSGHTYLRQLTGTLKVEHEVNPRFRIYLQGQNGYQKFEPVNDNQTAWYRKGPFWNVTGGLNWAMTPSQQVALSFTHQRKFASKNYYGYRRYELDAGHTLLLGSGQFLITNIVLGADVYQQPDTFISNTFRVDRNLRARMTYGAPLSFFNGLITDKPLPLGIGGLVWTITGEHYRSISNIKNYDYKNEKIQTFLTKTWRF